MSACLNCGIEAKYLVRNLGSKDQTFCVEHLPKFYKAEHFGTIVLDYKETVATDVIVHFEAEKKDKKVAMIQEAEDAKAAVVDVVIETPVEKKTTKKVVPEETL
jgi:hypothetical protein